MRIWYMRDNHTFLSLPLDVGAAMVELRRTFIDERDTYGSLCCKEGPMRNKMEHAKADWSEFEPRARRWIEAALKPTDAEIEYTSWLTPNGPGELPRRVSSTRRLGPVPKREQLGKKMNFDQWCAAHGVYLNDNDNAAKAAKAMARRAWDASVAAERERWTAAVMTELDSNGQAHAIVVAATRA